jgi:hypothetical protein
LSLNTAKCKIFRAVRIVTEVSAFFYLAEKSLLANLETEILVEFRIQALGHNLGGVLKQNRDKFLI